jgi:hypothetical protein
MQNAWVPASLWGGLPLIAISLAICSRGLAAKTGRMDLLAETGGLFPTVPARTVSITQAELLPTPKLAQVPYAAS